MSLSDCVRWYFWKLVDWTKNFQTCHSASIPSCHLSLASVLQSKRRNKMDILMGCLCIFWNLCTTSMQQEKSNWITKTFNYRALKVHQSFCQQELCLPYFCSVESFCSKTLQPPTLHTCLLWRSTPHLTASSHSMKTQTS